jgi:hypothetical protein
MIDTLATVVDSLPVVMDTMAAVADSATVAQTAPNEAVAKSGWFTPGIITELIIAFLALVKIVVNLTPTERDNKVFGLLDSILNALVPDRRQA